MFTYYVKNKNSQDMIIFGDGNQGKVKGLGKIAITTEHSISNVFLVETLEYNLLSVSQLCHMGYNFLFTCIDVSVFRRSDGSLAFKGVRVLMIFLEVGRIRLQFSFKYDLDVRTLVTSERDPANEQTPKRANIVSLQMFSRTRTVIAELLCFPADDVANI
jgi:hypothetical protein